MQDQPMYYIDAEANYPTVFILDSWKKFPVIFFDCKHRSLRNCYLFFVHQFGTICSVLGHYQTGPTCAHHMPIECPLLAHCVPTVCPPCAQYVSPFLPIICPLCTQYMSPFLPIVCLACAPLPVCSDRTCFPFLLNIRCTKQKHIFELKLLSLLQDLVFYPIITQSPRLYNFLCSKQYV